MSVSIMEKTYKCDTCGAQFSHSGSLNFCQTRGQIQKYLVTKVIAFHIQELQVFVYKYFPKVYEIFRPLSLWIEVYESVVNVM